MSLPRPNQKSGPLAGHVRKGRTFRSPLAATGVLEIGNWVRDDLPDFLWPALVTAELGTHEVARFVRWQKAVIADLAGQVDPAFLAECLDGRLTGLARLEAQLPAAKTTIKARAHECGILSPTVANALGSYSRLPADWLVDLDVVIPGQSEIDLLAQAIREAITDGHREAVLKCLYTWGAIQAQTFSSDAKGFDLLKAYPADQRSRAQADSFVRASWGSHRAWLLLKNDDYFNESTEWARAFWDANSMTTRCLRRREIEAREAEESTLGADLGDELPLNDATSPATPTEDGNHLRQLAMDLFSSYVEALETSPAHLYDRESQEVHSGLIARVGRDVITALGARDLWCMEHGAHIIRALVEVRIYIQWMATQETTIYRAFQEYGAGKAKLYARIMDELPKEARQPDFAGAVEELENLSHNNHALDHRVVDTRDSFAEGKSIRAMAEESGLLDLYRRTYYMASGVAHSEWWSVETHAMERCINALHGGHLIPSLSLNSGGNVKLASSWVDQLYTLMRASLRILGTDKTSVSEAFAWLDEDSEIDDISLDLPEA